MSSTLARWKGISRSEAVVWPKSCTLERVNEPRRSLQSDFGGKNVMIKSFKYGLLAATAAGIAFVPTQASAAPSAASVFTNLGNTIAKGTVNTANTVANGTVNTANTVANGTVNTANTVATGTVNASNTVANGTVDAANTVANGVVDAANTVANGAVDAYNTVANGAANAVKSAEDIAKEQVAEAKRVAQQAAADASSLNTYGLTTEQLSQMGNDIDYGALAEQWAQRQADLARDQAEQFARDAEQAARDRAADAANAANKVANGTVNAANTVANGAVNAVKTVDQTAKNVGNVVTDGIAKGVGYVDFAAAQAKGYVDSDALNAAGYLAKVKGWADLAAADAKSQAMGFKNYAERMAKDSAALSKGEFDKIRAQALASYSNALNDAKATYEDGRKALGPVIKTADSLANYVANTCSSQATSNWGKIKPYANKVTSLSGDAEQALNRVVRTIGRGSTPDEQTMRDMKTLGQSLGLITGNGLALVGNGYQSNFSISVGGSAGWVASLNTSVGFAMDTYPTNGKYNMAVTVSTGVQVATGTSVLAPGASIGFGLGWGPGSATGAEGTTMTAGGSVGGIDVSASWTFQNDLAKALVNDAKTGKFNPAGLKKALTKQVTSVIETVCTVPGISAGVSFPSSQNLGNVTYTPGYTHVIWTGSI
jgi:vacuolar-type H+-ATPase subunit H